MDLKENFVGQVVVNSGLWEVAQDIIIEINNPPAGGASSPIRKDAEGISEENVGGILLDTAYINIEEHGDVLVDPLLNSGFNFQGMDTLYWNTQYMIKVDSDQIVGVQN